MNLKKILQEQGKIYHNLTRNKTIQKCNETIEKPPKEEKIPTGSKLGELMKDLTGSVTGGFGTWAGPPLFSIFGVSALITSYLLKNSKTYKSAKTILRKNLIQNINL